MPPAELAMKSTLEKQAAQGQKRNSGLSRKPEEIGVSGHFVTKMANDQRQDQVRGLDTHAPQTPEVGKENLIRAKSKDYSTFGERTGGESVRHSKLDDYKYQYVSRSLRAKTRAKTRATNLLAELLIMPRHRRPQ